MTVLVGAAMVVFAVFWARRYHVSEFRGGQEIRDSGTFTYPRYHVQIGSVPLWEAGEHPFAVRGLPPGPLDLKFEVVDGASTQRDQLASLSTNLEVTITDGSGSTMCEANGRLSNAKTRGEDGWALASSVSQMTFWNPRCLNIPVKRSTPYAIKVRVSEPDPRSPHVTVVAMLEGGGIELP